MLQVHAGRVIFGLVEVAALLPGKVEPKVTLIDLLTCFVHKMAALMEERSKRFSCGTEM